tara:strand:- start:4036 stop:9816 length:5781 start_codon:yes stop_codon:yes gene_type:complete
METSKTISSSEYKLLYYGDIILIKSPLNPTFHNKYFFIKYIGLDDVHLIEKETFQEEKFGINSNDGTINDETIEVIKIVYRNPQRGYAKQNKLLPGTYVEIFFDTKIPKVITGRIVNLEEDMIEILILDSKNSIFIDFAYRGLSPTYRIKSIKIRDKNDFENEKTTLNEENKVNEDSNIGYENVDFQIENEENEEILNIEEIDFAEEFTNVLSYDIQLSDSEYRYNLKEQKEDLLNDLLSSFGVKQRTPRVMAKMNRLINRFEQTVKIYSVYNENGNLVEKPFSDKQLQLFLNQDHNENFNHSLHFIMPCIREMKKVIYIDHDDFENNEEEEDEAYIEMLRNEYPTTAPLYFKNDINELNKNLKNIKPQEGEHFYDKYNYILNDFFKPYVVDQTLTNEPKTCMKPIYDVRKNNIPFLHLNNEYISDSITFYKNKLQNNFGNSDVYTNYDHNMYYDSYLFLPLPYMYQSQYNNDNISLLNKSFMNLNYKMIEPIIKNSVITNIRVNDEYLNSKDFYQNNKEIFTNANLLLNEKDDKENYFDIISPNVDDIMYLFGSKEILSYKSLFNLLSIYKLGLENINYDILNSIKVKISKSISDKKREYIVNQKLFSKKLKPVNEINYDIFSQIFDDIGTHYGSLTDIQNELYNLQEIINYFNNQDNQEYFHINLVDKNRNLYSTLTDQEITTIINEVKDGTYNIKKLECDTDEVTKRNIVKIYENIDELMEDNYKNVYVDIKLNNEFKQDLNYYHEIKNKTTSNKLRSQLYDYARNDKLMSDEMAVKYINDLIQEQKLVSVNDFAVVNNGDKKDFYKWTGDHWEKEETDKDECLTKKECIKDESNCKQIDKLRETREKDLLTKLVEKIQDEKLIDRELLMRNIDQTKKIILNKLIFIRRLKTIKDLSLHNNNIKLLQKVKSRKLIESPYEELKESILLISDLNDKYKTLIQFAKQYTVPGDNPYYLYCIDTGVKLLPKILLQIAEGYFLPDEDFNSFINKLCLTQGVESDTGDSWVDKHSGYVIKRREFEEENMVDDVGNLIVNRSELGDFELGGMTEINEYKNVTSEEEMIQKPIGYKIIQSIILVIMNFCGIHFEKEYLEEMLDHCYEDSKKYADKYSTFNEEEEKSREKKKNDFVILCYCVSYLFIYLQTSIPNIKVRKSFSGCKKSFDGFPLEINDQVYSGIEYMSCIMIKIKTNSSPWNSLDKMSEVKLRDNLVQFIKRNVIKNSKIDIKLIQKRGYLQQEHYNTNYYSNINYKFLDYFKPIDLIKQQPSQLYDTAYEPLHRDYFSEYYNSIGRSDPKSIEEKEFIVKGHIMKQGLLLQALLHDKVQSIHLLLNSKNGLPFHENACCNEKNNNPITYFDKSEDLIGIIKQNLLYKERLNRILTLKKANTISCDFNIRKIDEDKFNLSHIYNEELIYRAFIKYLNFDHPEKPIPENILKVFDYEKPDYREYDHNKFRIDSLFDEKGDTIKEKIEILKSQKYDFTLSDLKTLLSIVHRNNLHQEDVVNLNIQNLQISEKLITIGQSANIDPYLLQFIKYKKSKKSFIYNDKKGQNERELNIYLNNKTNELKNNINKRFMTVTRLSKEKKIKYLKKLDEELFDISIMKERINLKENLNKFLVNDELDNSLQLIHNFIRLITIVLPSQVINFTEKQLNILSPTSIPQHWKFSSTHNKDIQSFSKKYRSLMKHLISSNQEILSFFKENKEELNEIYNVYNNGFYGFYTSQYDKNSRINPITMYQLSLYFYYFSLSLYFKIFDKEKNNKSMFTIIITIFELQKEYYKYQNMSYEVIIENVNKYSEGEKEKKKMRLSEMEDDERRTENELKKHKLGIWNKGLQSGIIRYDKEFYDEERQEVAEIEEELETGMFFESSKDQIEGLQIIDELYEGNEVNLREEENEYNLSRLVPEDEIDEQDDFDYDLGAGGYMQDN